MAFSFTIFRNPDLFFCRFSGHVTHAETRQIFTVALRHPDYSAGMPGLVDLSGLVSTDLGFTDVLAIRDALTDILRTQHGPVLIAMLASGGTGFGMARMFQTLANDIPGVHVEIFDTIDATLDFHGYGAADFPMLTSEADT